MKCADRERKAMTRQSQKIHRQREKEVQNEKKTKTNRETRKYKKRQEKERKDNRRISYVFPYFRRGGVEEKKGKGKGNPPS